MGSPRVVVRTSPIHGRGVFAGRDLAAGDFVGWYGGEVITAEESDRRHAERGSPAHTMFFARTDGMVVDGLTGGSDMRFLNHSCEPNCEAEEHEDGRIGFVTLNAVRAGAELFISYDLQLDEDDADSTDSYRCHCGTPTCRGSMLER